MLFHNGSYISPRFKYIRVFKNFNMNDFLNYLKTLRLSTRSGFHETKEQSDTLNALIQEFLERHPSLKKINLQDLSHRG